MMFENKLPRWLYWGLLITFIVVNGYYLFPVFRYLQPTLVLIVTAALLAFLLNYPVKLLVTWKFKRGYAIALVFLLALIILGTITFTLLPVLLRQLYDFPRRLPSWIDSSKVQLQAFEVWAIDKNLPFDVSAFIFQLDERFATEVRALPAYVINFALGVFDSSLELLITLVLTFYLLIHGDRFWSGIWQWLPDDWGDRVESSLKQSFENYFIGQATIALLMSISITTAFLLLKVPFGLLFGLAIGALVLIPLGDIIGIISVSLLTGLKSVGLGVEVLIVALIIDQAIDNTLAPRIFGNLVGLNPVWIIISLLLGAKLGGVLGLILAVPLAGAIKRIADSSKITQTTDH
ncbi:AI-2E family transporter [Pleurocapsa sp. CCALA 161]|uniref:AI-2E family transporter n=1 Tax=Pleurocapsa sp. CCALA 161 TaxID=2107688 RepID=UPI000D049056|nr:AI-2E family transporter [Pleurocapsa sp. CCALA 161]PSB10073.1 AI-2E family transporter [Pleurocapsa sp. CCALA 161]